MSDEETLDEGILDALPEEPVDATEDEESISATTRSDDEDGQFEVYDAGLNENGEYSY